MKKKIAPFISGIGTGLCLAVVIMTLWGFIWPGNEGVQASDLDQNQVASTDMNPAQDLDNSLKNQLEDALQGVDWPGEAQSLDNEENTALTSTPPQNGYKVIEVKAGMTASQIADLLAGEGIIGNPQEFHDLVVEQKKTQRFIAGKFTVRYGAPYEELISVLTSQPNAQ